MKPGDLEIVSQTASSVQLSNNISDRRNNQQQLYNSSEEESPQPSLDAVQNINIMYQVVREARFPQLVDQQSYIIKVRKEDLEEEVQHHANIREYLHKALHKDFWGQGNTRVYPLLSLKVKHLALNTLEEVSPTSEVETLIS